MEKLRARNLGVPFEGQPGRFNAITDVPGVWVGHSTLISGEGPLEVGRGPVRTGVTGIRPRGEAFEPVFAAWHSLNGCGEVTGVTWLEESGLLYGPLILTNTFSVGMAAEATTNWTAARSNLLFTLPVVAETYDGVLNDIRGGHIRPEHVWAALDSAAPGRVAEGNVGGGTGMICHGFKGGIGTASRRLETAAGGWSVGVLVQANHGQRRQLQIAGVPVGLEIAETGRSAEQPLVGGQMSSILGILATDCPLLPHQLKRLARRLPLGMARTGGIGENFSGDIFLAFSTQPFQPPGEAGISGVGTLPNSRMDPLFEAAVQATEEAVVNALVAAETMTGINDVTIAALPHDGLQAALKKYNRRVDQQDTE